MRITATIASVFLLSIFCVTAKAQNGSQGGSTGKSLIELQAAIKPLRNSSRYSIKYDKSDNKTKVVFSDFTITLNPSTLAMSAGFYFPGQSLTARPDKIMLGFVAYARPLWHFSQARNLNAVVDGDLLQFGEGERTTKGIAEYLVHSLSPDDLGKLANGKIVELRVGVLKFKLKGEHQQMLKDIILLATEK